MIEEWVAPDVKVGDTVYWWQFGKAKSGRLPMIGFVTETFGMGKMKLFVIDPNRGLRRIDSVTHHDADPQAEKAMRLAGHESDSGTWTHNDEHELLQRMLERERKMRDREAKPKPAAKDDAA